MQSPRTILITIAVTVAMVILLAATFVYSGVYNSGASASQGGAVAGILRSLANRSVEMRASGIEAPAADTATLTAGAEQFHAMCVVCHGAPGVPKGQIGEGLNPAAPELSLRSARSMSTSEIFWVIKNGIRFSGMPAFSSSRSDEQIWEIAHFVKSMDGMSEQEYERIFMAIKAANGGVLPGAAGAPSHQH